MMIALSSQTAEIRLKILCSLTSDTPRLFTDITPPSTDKIYKLIRSMLAKSSPLDKITTAVIKTRAGVVGPLPARLVTLFFSEGKFPVVQERACNNIANKKVYGLSVIINPYPTCTPFPRSLNASTCQGLQLTSGSR